ncbi:hypothetical protein UFOVP685_38 [uncultured Caudovirales phage]|uniref:Uncharacterized protein n=1 Tax=uncultured Caudovirales phage TaxID=2100421 RepID=A0A6J5NL42_9CAUD|nr:hypothetical protein UFOVP590_46 [uncultured Caudovirales phage]CAB4157638.1 hypothetical protein UFOVP685_38 [uncultured Caudovirales phage]CAB5225335.1 hypothetical protein UFOVP750_14 [uncultured Caudovirales phage]
MSKYICLCNVTFKTKKAADTHIKIYQDLDLVEGFTRHKIFIQHWQTRFAKWFFGLPWQRLSHFLGAYLIYVVVIQHFHIDWNYCEAALIGIGLGLYIE